MLNTSINIEKLNSFDELMENVGKDFLSDYSLMKLKSQTTSSIKNIVKEYPYVDKDFRSIYYKDLSKRHQAIDRNSCRIHLFDHDDRYLGFFTLRNTPPFNIGRSYLHPEACTHERGYFLVTDFVANIFGYAHKIKAFPWMQQDANISTCAQVSIWSVSRYYSERYCAYPEQTVQQIFDHAFSYTRKIPSYGLSAENISYTLSSIGFYPEIHKKVVINNDNLFHEIIYVFVESGIPIIAGLSGKKHALTLIGHIETNTHESQKESNITPISDIIKGYFTVDDNHLPYSIIGENGNNCISDIDTLIVPLYEKMYLNVYYLLNNVVPKLEREFEIKNAYRRVFMTSSRSLKSFIYTYIDDKVYKSSLLKQHMPKFVWIVEYIDHNEYPHKVFSRFIFDATAMILDDVKNMAISMRINNIFIHRNVCYELGHSYEPMYVNNLKKEELHGMAG